MKKKLRLVGLAAAALAVLAAPAYAFGTGDKVFGPACGDIDVQLSAGYPRLIIGGIDTGQKDKSKIDVAVDIFFPAGNKTACGPLNADSKQRMAATYSLFAQLHGLDANQPPTDATAPIHTGEQSYSIGQTAAGNESEIRITMSVPNTNNDGKVCLSSNSALTTRAGLTWIGDSAPNAPQCAVFSADQSPGLHYG